MFLKKLLLYLSFITFYLVAMEREIQSLENFVYSLNKAADNFKDNFTILPSELQHKCVMHVMDDKQLWYPIRIPIPNKRYINSVHFNHDSSKIFYYIWGLGTWENENIFRVIDINSGDDIVIPLPKYGTEIIRNNSNTQLAVIGTQLITDESNRIDIIDEQTNSIVTTLLSKKNTHFLQWNKDDTCIMNDNAIIWNIKTGEETITLPQDYKATDALWNNDNSLIASCNNGSTILDIWDTETKTLLRQLSSFVSSFQTICWNKDNIQIAFSNRKKTEESRSIYIYNVKTGECLFTLPLHIKLGVQHACFWKNNSEIFIHNKDKIMVVNTITKEVLSTIYNMKSCFGEINELCVDNKGIYFFYIKDKKVLGKKGFLWQQYTDFTLNQVLLYWLLNKWILIKKLKDISSIEQFLDDIVFYLPLDKITLLTIWNTFPEMVRQALWKHKIRYFI